LLAGRLGHLLSDVPPVELHPRHTEARLRFREIAQDFLLALVFAVGEGFEEIDGIGRRLFISGRLHQVVSGRGIVHPPQHRGGTALGTFADASCHATSWVPYEGGHRSDAAKAQTATTSSTSGSSSRSRASIP